jgi:hypothetical protein
MASNFMRKRVLFSRAVANLSLLTRLKFPEILQDGIRHIVKQQAEVKKVMSWKLIVCKELDGIMLGIGEYSLPNSAMWTTEGGENFRIKRKDHFHAPLSLPMCRRLMLPFQKMCMVDPLSLTTLDKMIVKVSTDLDLVSIGNIHHFVSQIKAFRKLTLRLKEVSLFHLGDLIEALNHATSARSLEVVIDRYHEINPAIPIAEYPHTNRHVTKASELSFCDPSCDYFKSNYSFTLHPRNSASLFSVFEFKPIEQGRMFKLKVRICEQVEVEIKEASEHNYLADGDRLLLELVDADLI